MDVEKPALEAEAAAPRRPNHVVEKKLGELDACLADALSFRPRRSDVGGRLFAEIQGRTDFLRTLIAAERECHGGARRPEHLAEAEARFSVLEGAFKQWAQHGVVAEEPPADAEKPEDDDDSAAAATSATSSGSSCSCTDSCFGFEVTGQEELFASDADLEAAETHGAARAPAAAPAPPATSTRRNVRRRRWWRRNAAWCGAAGAFVAVLAVVVGVAIDSISEAHHSVHLVPT